MALMGFNMYTSCYFVNLMMLFGQFTQNMSGAMNYTTTIFYEFQSLNSGSEDSLIGKMNHAIVGYYADYDEAAEYLGYEIG